VVSFPRSWRNYAGYAVGGRGGHTGNWRPGYRGTGAQPITPVPMQAFSQVVQGVPLTGGQAQTTVSAAGTATVSIGPSGVGTIWYPAQCTVSTSTGAADTSTCAVYLGAQTQANLQGGQSYAGGGDVVALSVPALAQGQLLIAVWTGAKPGDLATINIIGTMDALVYRAGT
jgi:hypothetical protein